MKIDPYVMGSRIIFSGNDLAWEFSSHWAAIAALVRLRDPEFKSLGGDSEEDFTEEAAMRVALARLGVTL